MTQPDTFAVLVDALDAIGVTDGAARLEIQPDVTFTELDVDSLGVIEIVARIESEAGVSIPDDLVDQLKRPADILAQAAIHEPAGR